MSWTSEYTGRPEEDGGHQRINISADYYTRQVLDNVENKSDLVEHSISVFTKQKCLHFEEVEESSNDSQCFKDGAIFELRPYFGNNSKIEEINASFNFLCAEGGAVEFRIVINDIKGVTLAEKSSSKEYSFSHSYNLGELGLKRFEAMLRGKDKYIFRFQFRPHEQFVAAHVKNINLFVDLTESPFIAVYLEKNKEENDQIET